MIRIFKTGAHAHRMPLSYPDLAPLFADHITEVTAPEQADLYVFAHILDIQSAPQTLVADWRRRQRPILLLSEEPFWDSIWARQPLARHRLVDSQWGRLPVHQLTHHSSAIFQFDRIPYYLLTNHRFANAYATRFARNAQLSAPDWQHLFLQRQSDLTFMFERRPEPHHSASWPEGNLFGLCHWRTKLAEACQRGTINRLGRSWQPGIAARSQLTDWHLDKMTRLDGHSRVMSAFENTHHPQYITEKLFDAFACGALPAYLAGPQHRIHEFGLPTAAWLNMIGLSPTEAAARLDGLNWHDTLWLEETCDAYAQAQRQLAKLLTSPRNWQQERQRLQTALLNEFQTILDGTTQQGHAASAPPPPPLLPPQLAAQAKTS